MTREECENRLLELAKQAFELYREYYPQGRHMSITCIDGYYNIIDAILGMDGDYTNEHMIHKVHFPHDL